ncbi:Cyclin-P4-1 [Apostasia shenzhenica]|uniref:Cyclin n=1 Tax=Apostasia shenzhenica TaxID=1088818 RepID=A0A2I0A432_9ASPA|nr:Cyclin-P4-1 [Apostasia shenzhenica]
MAEDDRHSVPPIVPILSALLQRVADCNDAQASRHGRRRLPPPAAAFSGLARPAISIRGYLDRIFRYADCSPSCFVVAYVYLDRFLHLHPSFAIDSFNVHRFLISAVVTAVKFMEDRCYNNAYFAKVAGISLAEMNFLEVNFLFGLRFELNVSPFVFTSYCSILKREVSPQIPLGFHCLGAKEEEEEEEPRSSSLCEQHLSCS